MVLALRDFFARGSLLLLVFSLEVMIFLSSVGATISDTNVSKVSVDRDAKVDTPLSECPNCVNKENFDITTAYTDDSGNFQVFTINSRNLSSSWVWENSVDGKVASLEVKLEQVLHQKDENESSHGHDLSADQQQPTGFRDLEKLKREYLRRKRWENRIAELVQTSKDTELQIQESLVERQRQLNNSIRGKYSIWRKEYPNPKSDSILSLMKDQIIMARAYASIARSIHYLNLADDLMKCINENQRAIGDAESDTELHWSALDHVKSMGHVLSLAKDMLYECDEVARKLRAMLQSTEESINALKKQGTFLIQHAAKTIPKPLHCLPLQLTTDYFLHNYSSKELEDKDKLLDTSLYHYAIFSDNVLATSVVVNSTALHAKEPEKHVFHIVTDRLIFPAMKMWFIAHSPSHVTVHVQNIDDFKWLNSSYCSVLRQLESSRLKEYYFKANHPSSLSAGNENLKYRNPKYLSMLNHLRFYMPEVYPELEKILFLDDDVVVQRDLTPLWSIDLNGMVNGAVETCKGSFHRFETYLNFSNPQISRNFDPQACGWAFGMNIFDLKEWKKRNMTGIYHYWQDLNEDRLLWKLGSLPPGLITFYNLTYPLDRSWHVLGLGYDPAVSTGEIEKAAVIHYNGNYKPWLDLAVSKYKHYWSKYVMPDNPYFQLCNMKQ